MKELKTKFIQVSSLFPNHSSLINFIRTVRGIKNVKQELLFSGFNKLVEKSDYGDVPKKEILSFLKTTCITKIV